MAVSVHFRMFSVMHLLALFRHLYKNHDSSAAASAGLLVEEVESRDSLLKLLLSQLSLTKDDVNNMNNFICNA